MVEFNTVRHPSCRLLHLSWLHYGIAHTQLVLNSTKAERNSKARLGRIIVAAVIVGVEKLLEPLQKFEIILKAALNEAIY